MILLQTLVMAVILTMIGVMVLKWVLGRYLVAARTYRSVEAKAHSQGYGQERFSFWNFNTTTIPSAGSTILDGKTCTYNASGPPGAMKTILLQSDEDQ